MTCFTIRLTIESTVTPSAWAVKEGIIRWRSVAGAIRVVTTAKAVQDGLLGETVTIRATDNKRVELDAVVVGPGAVEIGPGSLMERTTRLALGGQP